MNSSATRTARLMRQRHWQRDLTDYDFRVELLPRYTDINTGRHVSNVALMDCLVEAQMQYQVKSMGLAPWFPDQHLLRPVGLISNFLALTGYPAAIQGGVALLGKNAAGYHLQSGLFQQGACIASQDRWMAAWRDGERIELPADVYHSLSTANASSVPRPPSASIAPDCYPFQLDVATRWSDHDADGSVSEAAIAGFSEQARSLLLHSLFQSFGSSLAHGAMGMLSARIAFCHLRYVPVHGSVRIAGGASRPGRSSFTLHVGIFHEGICLALCDTVMVCVNREIGGPMPIPAEMRSAIEGLQCDAPEAICHGGRES